MILRKLELTHVCRRHAVYVWKSEKACLIGWGRMVYLRCEVVEVGRLVSKRVGDGRIRGEECKWDPRERDIDVKRGTVPVVSREDWGSASDRSARIMAG